MVRVRERPLLVKWAVRGVSRLSERAVKDKVQLVEARPFDPAAEARSRGRIDSLYRAQVYAQATVRALHVHEADSTRIRVVFDIAERRRVAIARLDIEGDTHFTNEDNV